MDVFFEPYYYKFSKTEKEEILNLFKENFSSEIEKIDDLQNFKKIVVAGSIQFKDIVDYLNKNLENFFSGLGFTLLDQKFTYASEKSQLLGCSYHTPLKKDTITVAVGDGDFHPGAFIYNKDSVKQILVLDTNLKTLKLKDFSEDFNKYLTRIYFMKDKFLNSKNIGIYVSTKPGQSYMQLAEKLKFQLEKHYKKNVFLFISNNIDSNEFVNFNYVEFIINTACSRIFTDDFSKFKNIINYFEFIKYFDLNLEEN